LPAQPAKLEPPTAFDRAFTRLYNSDFSGAHKILDESTRADPAHPLNYSIRGAALLFSELDRLKILQMDFFMDDDKVVDRKKLKPDPAVREALFRTITEARQRATARLAARADDREALFAMCMAAGLATDYAALIERRRFGSVSLSRQTQFYARKLLALNPPYYDAYLAMGTVEYVVGCIPWIFRWLIRFEGVQGSKQKGIENMQLVARHGRYYAPFARVLLSVIYLREKKPQEAERLLAGLVRDFPENPLLRRELIRVRGRLQIRQANGPGQR
jgi:hypothetical protein